MRRDLEAIGTNAHELPMVYAALAEDDAALARAPYDVLADWHEEHDGNLRIILPDTYGTEGVPGPRARLAGRAGPASASTAAIPVRGRDRDPLVAARAARTRATSWSSSPTGWTWTRSKTCTPVRRAACGCPSAGARC
jgi:hypothetical protein